MLEVYNIALTNKYGNMYATIRLFYTCVIELVRINVTWVVYIYTGRISRS